MAGSVLCRLMAEFKQMYQNPSDGIVMEDIFFEWEAVSTSLEGTYFEDGVFIVKLEFPQDYPLNSPKMKFRSDLFHPNIYPDSRVCISILHPPGNDPLGYESSSERWSPVQSIEKILFSVMSMMAEPHTESPANVDAAKMWREDKEFFKKKSCSQCEE